MISRSPYMIEPKVCLYCSTKPCQQKPSGTFETCSYGITYFVDSGRVLKKEPFLPLLEMARNIRHEVNPILQIIVEQASKIDPTISFKEINLANPASKILAATTIIDEFIQMICGITEFHTMPETLGKGSSRRHLLNIIHNYYIVHSIVKGSQYAASLQLDLRVSNTTSLSLGVDYVQYMISSFVDNIWKYSTPHTTVQITESFPATGYADITFVNISAPLPEGLDIFQVGTKANPSSRGFGYGLYWVRILEDSYNNQFNAAKSSTSSFLKVTHSQEIISGTIARQSFTISNIKVDSNQ